MKRTLEELEALYVGPLSPEEQERWDWERRERKAALLREAQRTVKMFKGAARESYLANVERLLKELST